LSHTPSIIEVDRPLVPNKLAIVRWLLEHGDGDNSEFLEQLNHARLIRLRGCASIDFSINGKRPQTLIMDRRSDYYWHNDYGHLFGALVFVQDGAFSPD
jgi:hypothetical protein